MKIVIEKEEGKDIDCSIIGTPIEVLESLSYVIGVYLTGALNEGNRNWKNVGMVIESIVKPNIKDGFFEGIDKLKEEKQK